MAKKQIYIDGIGEVNLAKRRGNTNIRLSYARDGSVRVSLPFYVPFQAGIQFVKSKTDWLQKHRPNTTKNLEDGNRIGKTHKLQFVKKDSLKSVRAQVKNNIVSVTYPSGADEEELQKAARRGAHKALKIEAEQLLPQRLDTLAKQHGFNYRSLATKRLTSRWGSCSQLRDIVLNIYLMQVPWHLIDYVIIHELVHTEHLDHSAGFWARFEQAMPDARSRRKELKQFKTDIITG